MLIIKGCECGGSVNVVTERCAEDGKNYVSHGVCAQCLSSVVLPQEEVSRFMKEITAMNKKTMRNNNKKG